MHSNAQTGQLPASMAGLFEKSRKLRHSVTIALQDSGPEAPALKSVKS